MDTTPVTLRPTRVRALLFGLPVALLTACQSPAPGPAAVEQAASPETSLAPDDRYPYAMFTYLAAQLARRGGHPGESAAWFGRTAEVAGRPDLFGEAVNVALQAGDADAAETYARRWRQAAPDRPEPLFALARTRAAREDAAGAGRAMARLVEAHAEAEDLLLSAGARLAEVGGTSVAVRALRSAAETHPDNAASHLAYGHLLARLGQREAAAGELRRALELRPDWEAVVVELARTQQVEAGLTTLRKFLADHPESPRVRLRYAQGLLGTDRPREAEKVFSRLAEERPEAGEVIMGVGMARLGQEDWAGAAEAFRRVLALDPGNNAALFHLGRAAEGRGDYAAAAGHYSRVHGGRYLQQARLREAVAALQLGDLQRALQIVRRMRAYHPQEPEYYRLEARILNEMDQLRAAEEMATLGLERSPGHRELLYTRAVVRERRGNFAGMEADIRRVIERHPGEARAYNFLGYSLADRGVRLDEALKLIRKARELDPGQGYIIDSLGWVYYRLGRLAEAERHLRRAHELLPEDPEILSHLGEVLEARGNPGEARQVWRRALDNADEGSALARELKRRLAGEG